MNESNAWIVRLADKWHEIPTGGGIRKSSAQQILLPDAEFLAWWNEVAQRQTAQDFYYWIFEVYRDFVRAKKMIDVGPGAGVLGTRFLREGARITFADVAESNLQVIERNCKLKGISGASFLPVTSFDAILRLADDYDAIFALGSLHHTPANIAKPEFEALASRLKVGGRFIALTYPKERWVREGSKPFSEFGKGTDGENTPWAEWYDADKFLAQLSPYKFRILMSFNLHNDDFNWFDFQRTG
jgi:SAM-dependent methyltransferase